MRLSRAVAASLPDPFSILDVSKTANSKQIKQAYYRLVKLHHPDSPSSSKPKNFDFKCARWLPMLEDRFH